MIVRNLGLISALLFALFTVSGCFDMLDGQAANQGVSQNAMAGNSRNVVIALPPGEQSGVMTKTGNFYKGTIVASDPTILRTSGGLRMYYTDLDVSTNRTVIATATSSDGVSWATEGTEHGINGLVLRGREGAWDENIESVSVVKTSAGWTLYYSGYRDKGNPFKGFPSALGMATSTDGRNFERVSDDPIMMPTKGWYDNDAIYSSTVLYENGTFYMIYVGHAYTNVSKVGSGGVFLLGATSTDGRNWTKHETPISRPGQYGGWRAEGLAEPYLVKRDNGDYVLFFTGLKGEERTLGVGIGKSPLGPFKIETKPILVPGARGRPDEHQVLAPAAVIDGEQVRLWYLAADKREFLSIGLAIGNLSEILETTN